MCTCHMVWRSEDNFHKLFLSFHQTGLRDWAKLSIKRLSSGKCIYLLSHLPFLHTDMSWIFLLLSYGKFVLIMLSIINLTLPLWSCHHYFSISVSRHYDQESVKMKAFNLFIVSEDWSIIIIMVDMVADKQTSCF